MDIAKLFPNGKSQAVRLPKEYRFAGDEVYVKKLGEAVILIPKDKAWDIFIEGINSFSSDFLAEGRAGQTETQREAL